MQDACVGAAHDQCGMRAYLSWHYAHRQEQLAKNQRQNPAKQARAAVTMHTKIIRHVAEVRLAPELRTRRVHHAALILNGRRAVCTLQKWTIEVYVVTVLGNDKRRRHA